MNFFSTFFIENELFTENVNKGSAVTDRTVERFNLHSWCLYQSKRIRVLYETIESFFRFFLLVFKLYSFFLQKNAFLPKKLNFQTA